MRTNLQDHSFLCYSKTSNFKYQFLPPIEKKVNLCPLTDHWTIDKLWVREQRILTRLPHLLYISMNKDKKNKGYAQFMHTLSTCELCQFCNHKCQKNRWRQMDVKASKSSGDSGVFRCLPLNHINISYVSRSHDNQDLFIQI